ncbi:hypothetical protein D3C84_988590 [compost metagenome]
MIRGTSGQRLCRRAEVGHQQDPLVIPHLVLITRIRQLRCAQHHEFVHQRCCSTKQGHRHLALFAIFDGRVNQVLLDAFETISGRVCFQHHGGLRPIDALMRLCQSLKLVQKSFTGLNQRLQRRPHPAELRRNCFDKPYYLIPRFCGAI